MNMKINTYCLKWEQVSFNKEGRYQITMIPKVILFNNIYFVLVVATADSLLPLGGG